MTDYNFYYYNKSDNNKEYIFKKNEIHQIDIFNESFVTNMEINKQLIDISFTVHNDTSYNCILTFYLIEKITMLDEYITLNSLLLHDSNIIKKIICDKYNRTTFKYNNFIFSSTPNKFTFAAIPNISGIRVIMRDNIHL